MSFVNVLNNLKTILKTDTDLGAFCQSAWNRSIEAELVFKHRTEISLASLPLILITWPGAGNRKQIPDAEKSVQHVRLYAGFYQPKAELALVELVEFDEAISDAITKDPTLSGSAMWSYVKDAVNDEGVFHPSYFTVIDIDVKFYRAKQ